MIHHFDLVYQHSKQNTRTTFMSERPQGTSCTYPQLSIHRHIVPFYHPRHLVGRRIRRDTTTEGVIHFSNGLAHIDELIASAALPAGITPYVAFRGFAVHASLRDARLTQLLREPHPLVVVPERQRSDNVTVLPPLFNRGCRGGKNGCRRHALRIPAHHP